MVFINTGDWIGQTILGLNTITGSLFMTLLLIFLILIAIAAALTIPITAIAILYLPLMIITTAYVGDFLTMFFMTLILLAFIIADILFPKN